MCAATRARALLLSDDDHVEITSGSGGQHRLHASLAAMGDNVYGLLYADALEPRTIAEALPARGWSARKASWYEFELTKEWCSFTLGDFGGQLKLAGVVAPARLDELSAELAALDIAHSLELYEGNHLLREVRDRV